jgi:hypothetical protein
MKDSDKNKAKPAPKFQPRRVEIPKRTFGGKRVFGNKKG